MEPVVAVAEWVLGLQSFAAVVVADYSKPPFAVLVAVAG